MTDKTRQNVGVFLNGTATLTSDDDRHGYIASVDPKKLLLHMARILLSHHLYPIYLLVFLALITSPSTCYIIINGAPSDIPAELPSPTTTSEYDSNLQTTTDISLSKSTTKESGLINPISGTSATGSTFSKSSTQLSNTSPRLGNNRDDVYLPGTSVSTSISKMLGKEANLALNSDELNDIPLKPAGGERDLNVAAQQKPHRYNESRISTADTVAVDVDGSGHFGIVTATSDPIEKSYQLPDEMRSENTYKNEPVVVLNEISTDPTPSSSMKNPSNNDTIFNPLSFLIPVPTTQGNIELIESLMEESTSNVSTTTEAPHTPPSRTDVTSYQETTIETTAVRTLKTSTTLQGTDDKHSIPPLTPLTLPLTQTANTPTIPRSRDSTAPTPVGNNPITIFTKNDPREHTTGVYQAHLIMTTVEKDSKTVETTAQMSPEITQQMTTEPSGGSLVSLSTLSDIPKEYVTSEIKSSSTVAEFLNQKTTLTTTAGTFDRVYELEHTTKIPNRKVEPTKTHFTMKEDLTSSNIEGIITSSNNFRKQTPVTKEYLSTMETRSTSHITTQIAQEKRPQITNPATNQSKTFSPPGESSFGENLTSIRPSTITEPSLTEIITIKSYDQAVKTSPGKVSDINQTVLPRSDNMPSEPSEDLSPSSSITVRPKSTAPSATKTLEMASPGTDVVSKHLDMNNATNQSPARTQESVMVDDPTFTTPSKTSQEATASLTDTEVIVDGSEISSPVTTLSTPQRTSSQSFTEVNVDNVNSFTLDVPISPTNTPTHKTTTKLRTTVGMISARLSPETSSPAASTTESLRNLRNTQTISNTPTIGTLSDTPITVTSTEAMYTATTTESLKTSKPDLSIESKSSTDKPLKYTETFKNAITLVPDSSMVPHDKRQTTAKINPSTESMISTDAPFQHYTDYQTTGEAVKISDQTNEFLEKLRSTSKPDQSTDSLISTDAPLNQYTGFQTTGDISAKPDQSTVGVISIDATVLSVSQTQSSEDEKRTKYGTLTADTLVDITMNPTTTTTATKYSETGSFGTSSTIPLRSSTYGPRASPSYSAPTTDKRLATLEQTTANSYTPASSVGFNNVTSDIFTPSLTNSAMYSTATTTKTLNGLTPSVGLILTTFAEAVTEESTTPIPPQTHTKRQTNYKVTIRSTVSQGSEKMHEVTTATSPSQHISTVKSTNERVLETLEAQTSLPDLFTPTTHEQISSHSQTTGVRHIETSITTHTTKETKSLTDKVTLSTQGSSSTQASSISSHRTSLKTSGSTLTASSSLQGETSFVPTSVDSSTEQQVTECEQLGNDCDQLTENCVNTYGEYQCECERGYYKNQDSVCLVGVSFYGSLRIDSVSLGGSTVSVHYTPELQDPNSAKYRELAEKVQNMLDYVFLNDTTSIATYKGCKMIQFRSGSIVAEFQLTQADVSTRLNETVLQLILRNAVDDGTVKHISGFVISSNSVLMTPLDECTKEVHDCSVFATCLDQPIGFSCICNPGYRDLHYDVIPGRNCQSVDRPQKLPTSQVHVIVAIVFTTSIVVLVTVTAFLAFVHRKCHTSSSTVKMPTVTAPRKISDAFLAGDVEAGVWCPAPGEEADAWSSGSSSSTCHDTGKTNSKNVHMAPIASISESEFEIGHDVIGGMNGKTQTVCSKSKNKQAPDQHKPLNSMMGNIAPSSGQSEAPDRQREV